MWKGNLCNSTRTNAETAWQCCRLGAEGLGSRSAEKAQTSMALGAKITKSNNSRGVSRSKWLYCTTQHSWNHIWVLHLVLGSPVQDVDKPEWILWGQQKLMELEHLQVIYILIMKQKQSGYTDILLKNEALHDSLVTVMVGSWHLASFRSTNKAVSCHPDSKIKKNLED